MIAVWGFIRKVVAKAKSANLVAALEEILGKPHHIGPLGVSDESGFESSPGEVSAPPT